MRERMSYIPTEIISEILCCLPIKSLLHFRCVCKSWRDLIDNPRSIKMHLNRSLELKYNSIYAKLILCGYYSLRFVSFEANDTWIDATPASLNYPFNDNDCPTVVLGCCNGLLLISMCSYLMFYLWNPSTRVYYVLPYAMSKKHHPYQWGGGFGYDQTNDDYKVVRILQGFGNQTLVYSLKSNTWRRKKVFPFWISQPVGGIFVFGALHWVVIVPSEVGDECMIVAFDLGNESYDLVPLPLYFAAHQRVDLGVLDGCLSMSCNYQWDRVDIWLKRDRGKKESWFKLLSLKQVGVVSGLKENVIPISYSRAGKCVILEKDKELLLLYVLETKSVRLIPFFGSPSTFQTFPYFESLVQLEHKGSEKVSEKMDQAEDKQKKH